MNKIYIVYKQSYEEFYVYGVFTSKESLAQALNDLAKEHLKYAKQSRKELQHWFDDTHIPWAEQGGIEPIRPKGLDISLFEFSKSLFNVYEIDTDEVILHPSPVGWNVK